jgi:hypothetical protein
MPKIVIVAGLALALGAASAQGAQARGCVKGAVVGGVAGHFAGHHPILGAAAGCAVGHHMAHRADQRAYHDRQDTTPYDRRDVHARR